MLLSAISKKHQWIKSLIDSQVILIQMTEPLLQIILVAPLTLDLAFPSFFVLWWSLLSTMTPF